MKEKSKYNFNLKRANDGGNLAFETTEGSSGAVDWNIWVSPTGTYR